jgi:hypothetical protein
MLVVKNPHTRDQYITFEEGPHIYTVHGDSSFTSVTTWNHSHFSGFNGEKAVENILRSKKRNDPTYPYYGMTKEEILEKWKSSGKEASLAGTKLHYDIECYYNQIESKNDSIEYSYFLHFVKDYPDLKPYRTEWMVYYEELKIAGSIDMIYENENGELIIYDWKRCKEIENDKGYFTVYSTTKCISHLPDTNFWHYSLQLNMYKTILEHKYGKKVIGLFLMRLHPDNVYKTYERIEIPILEKEMNDLLEHRKLELNQI